MTSTLQNRSNISLAPPVALYELTLQNFRCFTLKELQIEKPQILIIGSNGAGKTSLLEAIYYSCFAQSFRTKFSRQMIKEGELNCNIKLKVAKKDVGHEIFIGMSAQKKVLKLDNMQVSSHAALAAVFTCATLTQEDMNLIASGPERRRFFLNQNQFLADPAWLELARRYREVLEQRNALLMMQKFDSSQFEIWTKQLWQLSHKMQLWRQKFIAELNELCRELISQFLPEFKDQISLSYKPSGPCLSPSWEDFSSQNLTELASKEKRMGRTLFGAHLDDFSIVLQSRCARNFASRGEQKLLTLLLKCAALKSHQLEGRSIDCLLIDDFLTDLDVERVLKCQAVIQGLSLQTIVTLPILRRDIFPLNNNCQELIF